MNENDAAVAVTAWAREVLPELAEGRSWLTAQKTALPDVVADVAEKRIVRGDDRFPYPSIQQTELRVFECDLAFMVESENAAPDDEADRAETEQLRDFGARLETAIHDDATLGGRVQMASPLAVFNYRLPFVEYGDGTRGRQMTLNLLVAELI